MSKEDGGPSGRPSVTKMDGDFKVPYTMYLPPAYTLKSIFKETEDMTFVLLLGFFALSTQS